MPPRRTRSKTTISGKPRSIIVTRNKTTKAAEVVDLSSDIDTERANLAPTPSVSTLQGRIETLQQVCIFSSEYPSLTHPGFRRNGSNIENSRLYGHTTPRMRTRLTAMQEIKRLKQELKEKEREKVVPSPRRERFVYWWWFKDPE